MEKVGLKLVEEFPRCSQDLNAIESLGLSLAPFAGRFYLESKVSSIVVNLSLDKPGMLGSCSKTV